MGSKEKDKCKLLCLAFTRIIFGTNGEKTMTVQVSHEGNARVCKYAGDKDELKPRII